MNKTQKRVLALTMMSAVFCFADPSHFYTETFESFNLGSIDGQFGWTTTTGAGAAAAANSTIIANSSLTGTQSVNLGPSGNWTVLSSPVLNQTTYFSFRLQQPARSSTNPNEFFVRFFDGTNQWHHYFALKEGSGTPANQDVIEMRLGNSAAVLTPNAGIVGGGTYQVVGKLTWDGTQFSQFDLWLNPTGTEASSTPIISASSGANPMLGASYSIQFRSQNYAAQMDDITFATSWDGATVNAIPEPGSVALFLLGGAFLYWKRRRG